MKAAKRSAAERAEQRRLERKKLNKKKPRKSVRRTHQTTATGDTHHLKATLAGWLPGGFYGGACSVWVCALLFFGMQVNLDDDAEGLVDGRAKAEL